MFSQENEVLISVKKKVLILEFYSLLFFGMIPKENNENRLPSDHKGGQKVPKIKSKIDWKNLFEDCHQVARNSLRNIIIYHKRWLIPP